MGIPFNAATNAMRCPNCGEKIKGFSRKAVPIRADYLCICEACGARLIRPASNDVKGFWVLVIALTVSGLLGELLAFLTNQMIPEWSMDLLSAAVAFWLAIRVYNRLELQPS